MPLLLAAHLAFFPGGADAQGRAPGIQKRSEAPKQEAGTATPAAKPAELDEWLKRLVGRFRYEGNVKVALGTTGTGQDSGNLGCEAGKCYVHGEAQGDGTCTGFGEGAGVSCAIAVSWPTLLLPPGFNRLGTTSEIRWPGPFLDHAKVLYGIDPGVPGIRMMLVDGQSIALEAPGSLKGDTATFSTSCMGSPSDSGCRRTFRIRAWPDGRRIEMQFEVRSARGVQAAYTFNLRRL